ncbi:MAG: hypothetical protein AAF828_02615 [Bacteroidota bacterium]
MKSYTLRDWPALFVSTIFHPLLVPTYMLIILLLVNPFLFGVNGIGEELAKQTIMMVFLYTCFIPLISVAVMLGLGMVESIMLEDRMERIGPYLLVLVLYLWVYYNFAKNGQVPTAFIAFMLGIVIALSITFFLNVFTKISAHAVGMGGLTAMVLLTMLLFGPGAMVIPLGSLGSWSISLSLLLILTIITAGLVGSSRLWLKAHVSADIYGGYLIGFVSQLIALRYYF